MAFGTTQHSRRRSGRSAFGRVGRGEDLLGWLYRRHSEVFETEHLFEHVETALEDAGVHRKEPRQVEGCVFADLSGYMRLTEESGDAEAARVMTSHPGIVAPS